MKYDKLLIMIWEKSQNAQYEQNIFKTKMKNETLGRKKYGQISQNISV